MKPTLKKMFFNALELDKRNIIDLLEPNPSAKLLDLGCDDGEWTKKLANIVGTEDYHGLDIVGERLQIAAKENGVQTKLGNLNQGLPWENNTFDVVHSNQVFEHLCDLDQFISEIYRVLSQVAMR
ncbi:class I SAM-dependent methyltransferase [Candidatus Nomurabacteria bacterium]|nr:class I SAM-dependent methyltransferase [Candidatus Nomurabacteria bacterium]